ncbi:MAG TPA: hypothetical protein VGM23_01330, partial [Armatimonadota bacterium]
GGPNRMLATSDLPRQQYAAAELQMTGYHQDQEASAKLPKWVPMPTAGTPPVTWQRQVLFVKDDNAMGVNYLLLRDTVQGKQPTAWQMWTLSEKIGTPDEVKNLDAFLKDKPGKTFVDAHELKGDRFTAVGQYGVDVEYFIASPTNTPRHTLRCGYDFYSQCDDFQDLLHLQLPGDGAYFVAFYPRKRSEPVPVFSTLGDGKIIKVSGPWGTDYNFLSAADAPVYGEGVSFKGTAASVQDRAGSIVLSLSAGGEVLYQSVGLVSGSPASLRVTGKQAQVNLPPGHPATKLTVYLSGIWTTKTAGAPLTPSGKSTWQLTAPAGVNQVVLQSR